MTFSAPYIQKRSAVKNGGFHRLVHIFSGDPVTDVIRYSGKNKQTYSSIFRENLEGKDKYTVFLGQNNGLVRIQTNVDNGKKLLVFKDSFANAAMQF